MNRETRITEPCIDPSIEAGTVAMLCRDNAKMREAGCNLAEAAARVVRDYDGLHRLSIAISAWFSAIANEGDRDERHTASADTRPNVHQSPRSGSEPNKPLPSD